MTEPGPTDGFFIAGGTLPLDAVYVVRPADERLLRATLRGEYCNVLTPRQIGKSSLMVRTAQRLQEQGVRTAIVDLTEIGTELGAREWYFGLATCLRDELGLATDVQAWWREHVQLGPVQRFTDLLRHVVLEEVAEPIVVFVDEIDSTLQLPFTDDFFAAIRAAYNARASDPAYKRLTFVLLGVVWPADLIKDRSRTPYNVGLSIDLEDFTPGEAGTLLPGLETISPERAEAILGRVLYWTGGHPYLTQRVCAEIVAASDGQWTDDRIDQLVKRLFLSDEARKESNLQFVRDRIQESRDREKLLRTYRQVLSGKRVADEERDPIKSQLKLVGLLQPAAHDTLTVRNRIYRMVFDEQWIKDAMPRVTSTRVIAVSIVIALLALVVGAFLLYRQQNMDEILAQDYTETFLSSQSAPVRITSLAGLLRLDGKFADSARELFFGLDSDPQLAIFTGLDAPGEVGEDLQIVVKGLYTHLDNSGEHNALLRVMAARIEELEEDFPDSSILSGELDAWLAARDLERKGDYESATKAYNQAVEYGGHNPAVFWDRAVLYVHLEQYGQALADWARAIELDPNREQQVIDQVRSHAPLRDYLRTHQEEFPDLATSVE